MIYYLNLSQMINAVMKFWDNLEVFECVLSSLTNHMEHFLILFLRFDF